MQGYVWETIGWTFPRRHVKNVEGYIGMICERPMPGAAVGPTAGCILQRQYQNLREGDRWFHDRVGWSYGKFQSQINFDLIFTFKILSLITVYYSLQSPARSNLVSSFILF